MKLSITVPCHCAELLTLETSGTQLPKDRKCPKCHAALWFVQPLGNVVGMRILGRASSELKNGDFTVVIVLSAMAVECEMSRLFFKWKGIERMRATESGMPTNADEDAWVEEWRKLFSIKRKFDRLSRLLTGDDFPAFLSRNSELLSPVRNRFPDFDICAQTNDLFQSQLFDKRNKIVHYGEIDFSQADGERCFALASTLTEILKEMDDERRRALDVTLTAESAKRKDRA
jgi:hypothetical protein